MVDIKKKPLIVGFDVDDVLLDFVGELVQCYNESQSDHRLAYEDVTQWNLDNILTAQHKGWWKTVASNPTFFRNIDICPGAFYVPKPVQDHEGWRAVAVTSAIKESATLKWAKFMDKFAGAFSSRDYIEAEDKTLIYLDFMLDDKAETVRALRAQGVMAYLMDRPWNAHDTDLDDVRLASAAPYVEIVRRAAFTGIYGVEL